MGKIAIFVSKEEVQKKKKNLFAFRIRLLNQLKKTKAATINKIGYNV